MSAASNVISLAAARDFRKAQNSENEYHAKILAMDKLELLDEMVRFQEERSALPELTAEMMIRGRILFKALEESAETNELRLLTRSYRRHLEHELAEYMKPRASSS